MSGFLGEGLGMAKDTTERLSVRARRKLVKAHAYDNYVHALGEFVHCFSAVELAVHSCLYHHSKVSNEVRRAVFSGVRVKEGISFLRRLAEAGEINPEEWAKMKPLFNQLNILTDRRNGLLHYGADGVEEGTPFVSNMSRALTWDKVEEFPVSARMLRRMTHDLNTIFFALSSRHSGEGWGYSNAALQRYDSRRARPWHYISPLPKQNQTRREGKFAKRQRPPGSSQK
jgi:hypothetical protein